MVSLTDTVFYLLVSNAMWLFIINVVFMVLGDFIKIQANFYRFRDAFNRKQFAQYLKNSFRQSSFLMLIIFLGLGISSGNADAYLFALTFLVICCMTMAVTGRAVKYKVWGDSLVPAFRIRKGGMMILSTDAYRFRLRSLFKNKTIKWRKSWF